eukprot:Skav206183  [mRNA]  locus=scaffold1844:69603:70524:- [translate_table: standard]
MVYRAIVHAAKIAADNIVQEYAPTTSAAGVGGFFLLIFQYVLCILYTVGNTASVWLPVLAAVLLVDRHWHPPHHEPGAQW